jgi:cytochrome c553
VIAQLFLFREGRRDNAAMSAAARGLSDGDLQALAELIARLPPPPPPAREPDSSRSSRGRALAQQHRCGTCHNPDYSGGENVPRLANQREDYLLKALRDYKSGARVGYGSAVMPETVSGLSDADLADIAQFLAHLGSAQL